MATALFPTRSVPFILLILGACGFSGSKSGIRAIASTPIATTGPIARQLLGTPGLTWHSFESPHVRLHMEAGMAAERASGIADSVERARARVLALLGERDLAGEPPLELILVETRGDMQRMTGRPVAGSGFPSELTVVIVAGNHFRPFYRHELTHAYAAQRWGQRKSGSWLDEGLAARATGPCQGFSFDALAAGYVGSRQAPTLAELTGDFYSIPELPGYITAASLADFVARRNGIAALRSIWRAEGSDIDVAHPLGRATDSLWSSWGEMLREVRPGALDTARLRRDGC